MYVVCTLYSGLRDIWLLNTGIAEDLAGFPDLVKSAKAVADRLTPAEAAENLAIIENTQRTLHTTVQELLVLEVGMMKLKL